jgi:predicted nucleic acid-binding Zn ribbon protein
LIGAGAGIVFKGSGFYTTDSRKSTAASRHLPDKDKTSEASDKPNSQKKATGSPETIGSSTNK